MKKRDLLIAASIMTLSLASGDFDEDGVADLEGGYGGTGGGIVTLVRDNVDAIHPNAVEAKQLKEKGKFTDAPFLSPASVMDVPVAAGLIGAGDFDADGHLDIVTAAKGSSCLYVLAGDGQGALTRIAIRDSAGGSNPGGDSQQIGTQPFLRTGVNFTIGPLPGVTPAFGFVTGQAIVNNIPGEYGNCVTAGGVSPGISGSQ
jgi:FG-GAP repeat